MSVFYPQVTHNIGGNTSGTTANVFGNTLFLAGGNNITLSQDVNTITISAAAGGGTGGDAIRGIAAGGSTQTTDTVNLSNSNGFSFGFSSTNITASHNALTSQSTQYLAVQLGGNTAGTTSFNASNNASLILHGGNNITLSGNGSSITISAGASGSGGDAIRGIAAGGSTQTTDTVNFSNSNGISFGFTSTDLTASHNAITSQSTQYLAIELGGNTAGTTSFNASNNASIFLHGGNNITLSGNGSTITISGGAGSGGNIPVIYRYPIENISNVTINRTFINSQTQSNSSNRTTLTNTIFFQYTPITADIQFNQIEQLISFSSDTGFGVPFKGRLQLGIYTLNGSTLSLLSSFNAGITQSKSSNTTPQTSHSYYWWWGSNSSSNSSSTAGSDVNTVFSGNRRLLLYAGTPNTLTSGNYYFANLFFRLAPAADFYVENVYGNFAFDQALLNDFYVTNVDLQGLVSTTVSFTNFENATYMPSSVATSRLDQTNSSEQIMNIAVSLYSKY